MEPSSRITVNGVEYASWEQLPSEMRAALSTALRDQDGDGVPGRPGEEAALVAPRPLSGHDEA